MNAPCFTALSQQLSAVHDCGTAYNTDVQQVSDTQSLDRRVEQISHLNEMMDLQREKAVSKVCSDATLTAFGL